eukprot:FR744024.1.p1 GENE.FR744024.1~~FR744024.1.p1  ORF type:complete len:207 (-),score=110.09 FR744024.1:633-1178(-)
MRGEGEGGKRAPHTTPQTPFFSPRRGGGIFFLNGEGPAGVFPGGKKGRRGAHTNYWRCGSPLLGPPGFSLYVSGLVSVGGNWGGKTISPGKQFRPGFPKRPKLPPLKGQKGSFPPGGGPFRIGDSPWVGTLAALHAALFFFFFFFVVLKIFRIEPNATQLPVLILEWPGFPLSEESAQGRA